MNDRPLPTSGSHETPADRSDVLALLETVHERTGMEFHGYAFSSLHRRIQRRIAAEKVNGVIELHALVSKDAAAMQRLVSAMTVSVTSMFRDPAFFREFRLRIVPVLHTHPFLRLWVAGCASGQEVYSLAIVLHETGLYERSRIYATELQPAVLDQAAAGVYPLSAMQEYTRNYQEAGGSGDFSDYYAADASAAIFRSHLRRNVVFATHNLVSDSSFNVFEVIFCRNVMIYFDRPLQTRVHALIYDSLALWGYLGLGRSESVRFSPHAPSYEAVAERERLYRKIG